MSGSSKEDEPSKTPDSLSRALEDLRRTLEAVYADRPLLVKSIIDGVAKRTRGIARADENVAIGAIKDFQGKLPELYQKEIVGIAFSDLLPADLLMHAEAVRRTVMLRFLKHYLEPEEYKAVLISFELRNLLSNPEKVPDPPGMIRGLYEKRDSLRQGRAIYRRVSAGTLEEDIYPAMRQAEADLAEAGRVEGDQKEKVKQIFYRALALRPTELWVTGEQRDAEIFDSIYERLVIEDHSSLTIHGARQAWNRAQDVSERFVSYYYPEFTREVIEDKNNPLVGKIIITRESTLDAPRAFYQNGSSR